ncbi:MAG: hypothetical protein CXR30_15350 [Geobacter sp.]|nr:MAG: hypothetical protein CXR30_15350 [Geobacter sp.]
MQEIESSCRITRFCEEDRAKLEQFFKNVWTPPPQVKSANWLDWQCTANPNAGVSHLTLLLAHVGDRVVGMLVLVPTPIWIDGMQHEVAWGRDLFVDPAYRRYKIGLLLNEHWLKNYVAALGSGQSATMRSLQQKYGWIEISRVKQLEKLFFDSELLKKSVGDGIGKFCKRALAMLYAGFWKGRESIGVGYTVVNRHDFDARVEELWGACRLDYSGICSRDIRTLRWRFIEHPYYRYTVFEILGHDGAYLGYLVARREGNDCWLVDLLTRKEDHRARRALICQAEAYFRNDGVTRFICRSVCLPLETTLQSLGYLATTFEQYACIKPNLGFSVGGKSKWYITAMDSDLDR